MTAIAATAGMVFSLAIAILMEELIFGKLFRLFFVRQAAGNSIYGGRASSPVSAGRIEH